MKKSGFIEGAIIATIAIFVSKFIGIIYAIPFYGIVGDQGGALYGYAYNIYNLFLIISSAGIPLAISKLTSEYNALKMNKEKEYMFKATRNIILIFSITSFLICFFGANAIATLIIGNVKGGNTIEDVTYVIRCVSFAILVVPLLAVSRGYLQGHGYIRPASFSQVIEQIVRVIVIIGGSYVTLKVLHLNLRTAIGVAVFGACVGALFAYVYLISRLFSIKEHKNKNDNKLSKDEKKEIIKKIIFYSIPFIITNIANSLYNSTDMILLRRGLEYLSYSGQDIDTIASVFITWGSKLNTIITSIATGIAISLVPNIAKSNAVGNIKDVNNKFNKTIQIFMYVALPLAIFMSIFAKQVWTVFYGVNFYGPIIFKFLILTAAADALYILICNGLQGLNKSKLIYVSVGTGLILNLLLDLPLMYLFNSIGIYPFYGAICATIIGYTISVIIPLIVLHNKYGLNYKDTIKKIPKLLLSYIIIIGICFGYRLLINNEVGRIKLILLLGLIGIVILLLYLFINRKEIESILGCRIRDIFKRKKRDN